MRMAKEVIHRSAADNEYLHRDFHGALSAGLEYVDRHYGADAVRDFLRQFAAAFYAPLTEDIKHRGLAAVKERIEKIYAEEDGDISISLSGDELVVEVSACPAVTHMRANGYAVSALFGETTRTVYEAICDGTPFEVEMLEYDNQTGRSRIRFYRRSE
jgi:hypothetical protein